uniref:Peptidase S1 domain-containing protein n=1 Tax=Romanomermis culicivorax TaxID=13658 RepID=A0A915J016_ROMCU
MQFCISRIALRLSLLIFALNVTWLQGAHRSKRVLKTEITEYAKPHSKPWMAILLRPNRYRDDAYIPCGAFLINRPPYLHDSVSRGSSDLLLTAGHCLVDNGRLWSRKEQIRHTPDKFTVFLGKHNASGYEDTEQRFHVINSIVHKKYVDINDPKYDIGLIQLNRKVAFNEFIKPIPLIKLKPKLKTNCSMSGWGSKHALEDTWNFGAQGRYGLFSTLATAYFSDATMNDSRIQYKNVSKERRTINTHKDLKKSSGKVKCSHPVNFP